MGRECGTSEGRIKCIRGFGGEASGKALGVDRRIILKRSSRSGMGDWT
jgi:hypothetical protein